MSPLQHIFVSGMFRSGTTLLGRMLDSHPQVCLASDPFLPAFKHLRSQLATGLGLEVLPKAPLGDYYFDARMTGLLDAVMASDGSEPVDQAGLPELRRDCADYGRPFSPRLADRVDGIRGKTWAGLIRSLFDLTAEVQAEQDVRVVGFKEVWADEFIPLLARVLPQARFIQIVRDPRAVCASKNAKEAGYPWVFLCRQWRKLACLADHYGHLPGMAGRVLTVRYEDLVARPEETARRMAGLLDLEYHPAMADPSAFKGPDDQAWTQNSSLVQGSQSFDAAAASRWRTVLDKDTAAYIEALCGPEIRLHGYPIETGATPADFLPNPPRLRPERMAAWIRDLYPSDPLAVARQTAEETLRQALLESDGKAHEETVRGAFLFPTTRERILRRLRAAKEKQ